MSLANSAWPKSYYNNQNTAKTNISTNTDGSIKWTNSCGFNDCAIGSDGILYGTEGTDLVAISIDDGSELWRLTIGSSLQKITIDSNNIAYIGDADYINYIGYIRAVDLTNCVLLWTYTTDTWKGLVYGAILECDDSIYFTGQYSGQVYSLYKSNGSEKWYVNDSTMGDFINISPVLSLDGNIIYMGCQDYNLYAYNTSNGSIKWYWSDPNEGWINTPSIDVNDGTIYFSTSSGNIYALIDDGTSASLKWVWDDAYGWFTDNIISVGESNIYCKFENKYIYSINKNNGITSWNYNTGKYGTFLTLSLDLSENIFCPNNYSNYFLVLDKNGNKLWDYTLPSGNFYGDTIIGSNLIIIPYSLGIIAFSSGTTVSNISANVSGTWKSAIPYINVGGVWKQATINCNISSIWK